MNYAIKTSPDRSTGGRPRYKSRSGKAWTGADISRLIVMAERQVPARRIAAKLRRSEGAVRAEAARQRVMLGASDKGPTAKRPYGGITAPATAAARTSGSRRNRNAPSPSRARAQAPGENFQDTLF